MCAKAATMCAKPATMCAETATTCAKAATMCANQRRSRKSRSLSASTTRGPALPERSNEYFISYNLLSLAKFGSDTAENEPLKVLRVIQFNIQSCPYSQADAPLDSFRIATKS